MFHPGNRLLLALLVALVWSGFGTVASFGQNLVNADQDDIAIKGYDPVAYFTDGRPIRGEADIEHVWQDSRWRFASDEHRRLFQSDPGRYAPRYGGYCAGAMTLGLMRDVDPEAWVIVGDRLYLNWNKKGRNEFAADPEPRIEQADAHWQELREREAGNR